MKPIVFYDFYSVGKDRIEIERDKFEKLLNNVYNAGFEDGKRDSHLYFPKYEEWKLACNNNVKRDSLDRMPLVQTNSISNKIQ